MFDVRDGFATTREHQHRLDQDRRLIRIGERRRARYIIPLERPLDI
ncbi:MAG: hypothetical protein ABIP21_06955 [Acidimicrobiia bacterium]